jgi:L-alanine-DL-glutamate epimerase-like enolase superfamily enzyme
MDNSTGGITMKISRIETIRVGEFPQIIWVQVHTDTGLVGLGETWYAASTVQAAVHDHFGPTLIGRDPFAIERHWQTMFALSDHAGYGGGEMRAISALDMALWDIKGRRWACRSMSCSAGPIATRSASMPPARPMRAAASWPGSCWTTGSRR